MKYHLFLDDERMPKDVKWVDLPPLNWIIVRNYDQFVKMIEENGVPETISFDHDLADEHYSAYVSVHNSPIKGKIPYDKFKEKTGYDCAKWLANFCVDKNIPIPVYYIHTLNPIGRMNIFSVLSSANIVIKQKNEQS